MIPMTLPVGASQPSVASSVPQAFNDHPVSLLSYLCTHGTEFGAHGRDPVALFDAQFLGSGHDGLTRRNGCRYAENRKFINGPRNPLWTNRHPMERSRPHTDVRSEEHTSELQSLA